MLQIFFLFALLVLTAGCGNRTRRLANEVSEVFPKLPVITAGYIGREEVTIGAGRKKQRVIKPVARRESDVIPARLKPAGGNKDLSGAPDLRSEIRCYYDEKRLYVEAVHPENSIGGGLVGDRLRLRLALSPEGPAVEDILIEPFYRVSAKKTGMPREMLEKIHTVEIFRNYWKSRSIFIIDPNINPGLKTAAGDPVVFLRMDRYRPPRLESSGTVISWPSGVPGLDTTDTASDSALERAAAAGKTSIYGAIRLVNYHKYTGENN